jgi:hypothetical protein
MSIGQPLAKFVIPDGASAPIRDPGATRTAVSQRALDPGSRSGIGVARDVQRFGPRLAGMTVSARA